MITEVQGELEWCVEEDEFRKSLTVEGLTIKIGGEEIAIKLTSTESFYLSSALDQELRDQANDV